VCGTCDGCLSLARARARSLARSLALSGNSYLGKMKYKPSRPPNTLARAPAHTRTHTHTQIYTPKVLFFFLPQILGDIGAEAFFPPIRPFASLDLDGFVRDGYISV